MDTDILPNKFETRQRVIVHQLDLYAHDCRTMLLNCQLRRDRYDLIPLVVLRGLHYIERRANSGPAT